MPSLGAPIATDGPESQRRPAQWPHRPDSGQLHLLFREPSLLKTLKTHPGGHRKLRRYDNRIKALWRLLHRNLMVNGNLIEEEPHVREFNVTEAAELLGVARSTVQGWLGFFERRKWIVLRRRRGGRGVGLVVELSWAKRGLQLAERRQRALAWKAQQVKRSSETVVQRQRAFTPYGDSTNRTRLMGQARMALTTRIHDRSVAIQAVRAFGRWVWRQKPSPEEFQKVSRGISEAGLIPIPRWVKSAADVHRWMRSLITKLLRYGAAWWGRLNAAVQRRRLERTLARIWAAVDAGKPCPVCNRIHDRWTWREGRDAGGRLNCAGWARIKLEELQPEPLERRRVETNEDFRLRWEEEQTTYKTPLWRYLS